MPETPDAAVRAFVSAWQHRRWNAMLAACQTSRRKAERVTENRLRNTFGPFKIVAWTVQGEPMPVSAAAIAEMTSGRQIPMTPEAVDVVVNLRVKFGNGVTTRVAILRVIREDGEGMPMLVSEGGSWGVNEISATRQHA